MNINDCAKHLLNYFSSEERSIPDSATYPGRNAAVAKALNHGLQELFGKGKRWVRKDERGAVLNAPTAVTIAVTTGSTTGTITGWVAWMAGCTIIIDGAAVDNQIRNASSTVRLKYPYSGATGTRSAVVYHNSVELDADVFEIGEPVMLDGRRINPVANAGSLNGVWTDEDFGFINPVGSASSIATTAAPPTNFSIDTWSPDDQTAPVVRIRLFPAPAAQHFLAYPVMLRPPHVTDLASTNELPIPFENVESIFLPMAVSALRQSPFWRGMGGEDAVDRAEVAAHKSLLDSDPNKAPAPRFVPPY